MVAGRRLFLMGGYTTSVVLVNQKPAIKHQPQPLNFEVLVRPRILIEGKRFVKAWPRKLMPEAKYGFGSCLVLDGSVLIAGGAVGSYSQTDTCQLYNY